MFQEMREVNSDRPTRIVEKTSGGSLRLDREEADRTRYEEANFTRDSPTRRTSRSGASGRGWRG